MCGAAPVRRTLDIHVMCSNAASAGLAVFKYEKFILCHFVPRLIIGQWLRGNHRDAILWCGVLFKVNGDIRVLQMCGGIWILGLDVL